jgi:hypothetical protein
LNKYDKICSNEPIDKTSTGKVVENKEEDNLITEKNDVAEYEKRSYVDLSSEFKRLYPSALRAFQLIALMYNRLTLVEKLSHKDALAKIYNDHKHLPGFSKRNIRRNLPLDNPSVPRRIRPSWPKNSGNEANEASKLSITTTTHEQDKKPTPTAMINDHERGTGVGVGIEEDKNPKLLSLTSDNDNVDAGSQLSAGLKDQSNQDLKECSSCKELSLENRELKEALEKASHQQLITADNLSNAAVSLSSVTAIHDTHKDAEYDILEFEFHLLKEDILEHMGELYPLMDGDLKVWFSGKIDKKNGHVISPKLGRINEQQRAVDFDNRGSDMQNE